MAYIITADNVPEGTAYISRPDNTPESLLHAFKEARYLLVQPECRAAIVQNSHSATLPNSVEKLTACFKGSRSTRHMYTISPKYNRYKVSTELDDNGYITAQRAYDRSGLIQIAGEDVVLMGEGIEHGFPPFGGYPVQLIQNHIGGKHPHLDGKGYSFSVEELKNSLKILFSRTAYKIRGDITCTMTPQGLGTGIALDNSTRYFVRRPYGRFFSGVWSLTEETDHLTHDDFAFTQTGDITCMRGQNWPKSHKPTLHKGPSHDLNEAFTEKQEDRILAVSFCLT